MAKPILECGHSANATDGNGDPACAVHSAREGGTTIASATLDLADRFAKCSCGATAKSSEGLAFFEYLGESSNRAKTSCRNCSYGVNTHLELNPSTGRAGHKFGACEFQPKGASEYDGYYCGCRGWD